MPIIVPFTSDYDQTFTVGLGDQKYVVDARWNERGQLWTCDLTRDTDQVQIISGLPLLSGQELLLPYALGIGGLTVTDLSRTNTDPGPDDLGDRVIVTWLSNDELAIIKAYLKSIGAKPVIVAPGVAVVTPNSSASAAVATGTASAGGGGGGTTVLSTTVNNYTTTNIFNLTGAGGFGSDDLFEDSSGTETLLYRAIQNAGANPNPTVTLAMGMIKSGTGTIRVYVGGSLEPIGTTGTLSGTLAGIVTASGVEAAAWVTQALSNPGGLCPIKVTLQATSPPTIVGVTSIAGILA
jgi:hypothetical protein